MQSVICFTIISFALILPPVGSARIEEKPAIQSTARLTAGTLCGADETVLFSTTVAGSGKLVSICGSRQLDSERGYLQYRFGRPAKIELEFPSDRQNTQSKFAYTRYTRPLVTYLTVSFRTDDHEYSIHQDSSDEERPAQREVYITVATLGAKETESKEVTIKLRTQVKGSLMNLERIVPEQPWWKEK